MDMEKNFMSSLDREENKPSVSEEVKPKISLEATVFRLRLRYFGHVIRANESLEWDIMLRQSAGYGRQGKPWMHWLDTFKEATRL